MRFILDFDRTLFDTEKFYRYLKKINLFHFVGTVEIFDYDIDFSQFVYEDAITFLAKQNKRDIKIISAFSPVNSEDSMRHQQGIIYRSGIVNKVSDVELVDVPKGEVLNKYESAIFVDDTPVQLESVCHLCPQHRVVRIKRPGTKCEKDVVNIPEIETISTLNQLSDMIDNI